MKARNEPRPRVPEHVVYQRFPNETVMLNLESGTYHGLNTTAGLMLDTLEATGSIAGAAARVADLLDAPREVVQRDMESFCEALIERGLLFLDGDDEPS